jgi:hypothetical protein
MQFPDFIAFFALLPFAFRKKKGNWGEKVVVVEVRQGNLSLLRL